MKKNGWLAVAGLFVLLWGCGPDPFDGVIKDGPRSFTLDVENRLFSSVTETNIFDQGPGLTEITVLLTFSDESPNIEEKITAADIDSTLDYSQISVDIEGELASVTAQGSINGTLWASTIIEEKAEDRNLEGWEIFANVIRLKLGLVSHSDDWTTGSIDFTISPCGGNHIKYLWDSGVLAINDYPDTDWAGTALISRQVAIEPLLRENPEGLSFDIYYRVVDLDLKEEYNQLPDNPEANYNYAPWVDVWTYEEVTDTGKKIGDEIWTLELYNMEGSLNFSDPDGAGCRSFVMDLTTLTSNVVGKYLLFTLVVHSESVYSVTLSVPASMGIIPIN